MLNKNSIYSVKVYYVSTGGPIKDIGYKVRRLVKEASYRGTTLERRMEIRMELTQLRREKRKLVS